MPTNERHYFIRLWLWCRPHLIVLVLSTTPCRLRVVAAPQPKADETVPLVEYAVGLALAPQVMRGVNFYGAVLSAVTLQHKGQLLPAIAFVAANPVRRRLCRVLPLPCD